MKDINNQYRVNEARYIENLLVIEEVRSPPKIKAVTS